MALHPKKREDLLRDATQYAQRLRVHVQIAGRLSLVFVGIRANGSWSVYFDEDPVWQFTSGRALRRAYVDGIRISATSGKLQHLLPRRSEAGFSKAGRSSDSSALPNFIPKRLQLEATQLSASAEQLLRGRCQRMLAELHSQLETQDVAKLEQVPSASQQPDLYGHVVGLIQRTCASPITIAESPAA